MTGGAREHYLGRFAAQRAQLAGASLPWLQRLRDAAIERFAGLGLPTTRHEDWKYTNVSALERRLFGVVADGTQISGLGNDVAERELARHALDGTHRLVFVDGRYAPGLSHVASLPRGADVGSLADLVATRPEVAAELLDTDSEAEANGFAALNAAFWADGAYIDLAPGVAVDAPVHLLFVATRMDLASFPRIVVRAGAGAEATVIEHYAGSDDAVYLTDALTRIEAGAGARVTHAKVQQESQRGFHIAGIHTLQAADSRFASHSFAFGGQLARNDIATRLDGEGCAAKLAGLYVGSARQHHDHHTCIDHARPRGTSRELYKGVLDDASRAVFNGRVIVRPGAQRTDAQQSNHNLLLSDGAEVDTKPQLEIWADDVQCAHGATVGQLDAERLHYLRARGLDAATARGLLIHAFAADVLRDITHAGLRARLSTLLPGQLPEDMGELECELLPTS